MNKVDSNKIIGKIKILVNKKAKSIIASEFF